MDDLEALKANLLKKMAPGDPERTARLRKAHAAICALEAKVAGLERELASRPQWAGGQSPITCGPSGSARTTLAGKGEGV